MIKRILYGLLFIVLAVCFTVGLLYFYNTNIVESENPRDSAPPNTKFVDIGGEYIAYSEIDNNAPVTVVFVGGLSAWNGTWERTIRSLNEKRKDYNYVAIDLPPFGYSEPAPEKGYFRDIQSERISAFIKEKGIARAIFVGHSYGGGPITEYVLDHPERVEKLILIDAVLNIDEGKKITMSGPVQNDLLRDTLIGVLIHNDLFALSRLKSFAYQTNHIDQALLDVYTDYFKTKETTQRLSKWLKAYMNDPLEYDSTDSHAYANLNIPMRLIWGNKDTLTPITGTEILLKTVPDVQLFILENVGHIPMIEDYDRFDTALAEAVDR